jgi:hypothetical protein
MHVQGESCTNYKLDMKAEQFGACLHCGKLKKDHLESVSKFGLPRSTARRHEEEAAKVWLHAFPSLLACSVQWNTTMHVQVVQDSPCDNYKLDMKAEQFGACLNCGKLKKDHPQASPLHIDEPSTIAVRYGRSHACKRLLANLDR